MQTQAHAYSHVFFLFPPSPICKGFVSFRHPERGSWLMEALCQVFMKHAHKLELESLMKMVSQEFCGVGHLNL